jgi:tetratricopeptide (TPR) repeat protein
MGSPGHFADVLGRYVERTAYTPGQLATLSTLPKSTIVHWLSGHVDRPRDWQSLLRLLAVLYVSEGEASEVLQAAGHPALAALRHMAVTEGEQELLAPWARGEGGAAPGRPPFQAIADIPYFVGREDLLAAVKEALQRGQVCTVVGMAGVGKTALAARLAYELRSEFRDGVLWARPDSSPAMAILSTFADAYGVDVAQYADVDSRSRVVRDLLAHRRVLIVLDDVTDSASTAPLLPPTGSSAVLITTRRRTLHLAQHGPRFVMHPFVAEDQSVLQLFAHFLGQERTAAEAADLERLAQHVGHLPLALVIVAARLAYEPGWTAHDFLQRLRRQAQPLQALQTEDQSVRQSFAVSFGALDEQSRSFFAGLSVFSHHDFAPQAAAAVNACAQEEAEDTLRRLFSLSLIRAARPGRYQLHPLLAAYAAEMTGATGTRRRLVDYFAALLEKHAGDDALLQEERDNILLALELAWNEGRLDAFRRLILSFTPFLYSRGLYRAAEGHLQRLEGTLPDGPQRARVLLYLAQAARHRRHFQEAESRLDQAGPLVGQDTPMRCMLHTEQGIIAACRGYYRQAFDALQVALTLARESGAIDLLIPILKELGATEVARGHYDEAGDYYGEAWALVADEDLRYAPTLLRCLGGIAIARDGDYAAAQPYYEEGLRLAQVAGNQVDVAFFLNNLAVVAWEAGDQRQAVALLHQALALARRSGQQSAESMLLANLGRIDLNEKKWSPAEAWLRQAEEAATNAAHHDLVHSIRQSREAVSALRKQSPPGKQDVPAAHLRIFFD